MRIINEQEFSDVILKKEITVVDFFADWCGPCRVLLPILEEIESELKIEICKINVDECPKAASECEIMSIPTLMLFKNGEKISHMTGASSKSDILHWIGQHQ